MKKVIISAALLMVMGADVLASGVNDGIKGSAKANVETTTRNGVYNLIYKTATAGTVKVTITNGAGEVVLVDTGNGSAVTKYQGAENRRNGPAVGGEG